MQIRSQYAGCYRQFWHGLDRDMHQSDKYDPINRMWALLKLRFVSNPVQTGRKQASHRYGLVYFGLQKQCMNQLLLPERDGNTIMPKEVYAEETIRLTKILYSLVVIELAV